MRRPGPARARISISPCPSRPMLPHRILGHGPRGRVCAPRETGYTHQKSKDSCKGERHAARQHTVSDGYRHEARGRRICEMERTGRTLEHPDKVMTKRGKSPGPRPPCMCRSTWPRPGEPLPRKPASSWTASIPRLPSPHRAEARGVACRSSPPLALRPQIKSTSRPKGGFCTHPRPNTAEPMMGTIQCTPG